MKILVTRVDIKSRLMINLLKKLKLLDIILTFQSTKGLYQYTFEWFAFTCMPESNSVFLLLLNICRHFV